MLKNVCTIKKINILWRKKRERLYRRFFSFFFSLINLYFFRYEINLILKSTTRACIYLK